jgi:hypothetical protein
MSTDDPRGPGAPEDGEAIPDGGGAGASGGYAVEIAAPGLDPALPVVIAPPDEPDQGPAPAAVSDDDLREAVGVARRAPRADTARPAAPTRRRDRDDRDRDRDDRERDRDDRDDAPTPAERARRRKLFVTLGLSLLVGLVIAAFVLLGRANADRLVFTCGADKITAEHGRSFPPWGTSTLDGPEWAPIAIPPQAECEARETDDLATLEGWYLDALYDQASAKLAAREVTAVDDAEAQLRQALLLARSAERRDQRANIERLLGDVVYWRGAAKTAAATATLLEAAKLFDEAAAKKPRNVSDAAAWGAYTRRLAGDLKAGPDALRPSTAMPPLPGSTRSPAPPGVPLPVESSDGGAPMGDPLGPVPPDAGVPTGGVLL